MTEQDDEKFIERLFAGLPRKAAVFGARKEDIWQRVSAHIRAARAMRDRLETRPASWTLFGLSARMIRVGVTVLVVVIALTVAGGAAYAQPGQTLYPVKIAAEQVELVLATGDEAKVSVGIKHAKRRLAEVQTLVQANRDTQIVQDTLDALKSATDEVVNVASTAESNSELVTRASEFASEQETALSTMGSEATNSEVKDAVQNAISAAQDSLSKLEGEEVKGVASTDLVPTATPSTTPTALPSTVPVAAKPPKIDMTLEAGILIDEVITIGDDNQITPVGK